MKFLRQTLSASCLKLALLCAFTVNHAQASTADIESGKALFDVTCAGCHGKNLGGGAGFNLKDETWVHGASADEILANVKQGFASAGMPGFENVYSEQQLKNIVDYILSRREGFDNLSYKIYHLSDDETEPSFNAMDKRKAQKSGVLRSNLMDFTLPEVKHYMITFEGDLYTPTDQTTHLFGMTYREPFQVEIDGEVVKPSSRKWMANVWPLKRGKQHFKFTYSTAGTNPKHGRNFKLFVNDDKLTQKLFGLTTAGKRFMNNATVNITADESIQVIRKKIVNLPSYSISVGYPEKINYAFNTKSCAVVGLWSGELLNVGPNVEGRGRDGGVILGDWGFHLPQAIAHESESKPACKFVKYSRNGNPVFEYKQGENVYSLSAKPISTNSLAITYTLIKGSKTDARFTLPASDKLSFTSNEGVVDKQEFAVTLTPKQPVTLTVTIKG